MAGILVKIGLPKEEHQKRRRFLNVESMAGIPVKGS
jgi:hypothetical protein